MANESLDHPTHVFQSLWVGRRLSPLEHLCIKSFLAHDHTFVLYAYDEIDNVPQGCTVEDARTILPEESVFLLGSGVHVGTPSTFSNRFRYALLESRGGWWVDTDVLCLKREIPETEYAFAKDDPHLYNGAVLRAPRDSEFLSRALARATEAGKNVGFGATGPALVDELVRELGLENRAWAPEDVYPVLWDQALRFLDPAHADRIEALAAPATFVHFYTAMLRLANVLKDVRPPKSSYLDRMYEAYDVEFPGGRRYEWSEIEPQCEFEKEHWSLYREISALRDELARVNADNGSHGHAKDSANETQPLREYVATLEEELRETRKRVAVLQNMKVVRWSAPARRIVSRLRALRG